MWLTDLSHAVQASGLVVHEVSGWQTRGDGAMDDVRGIVEHHTAGPKTGNMPSLDVLIHGRPGIPPPLCNLGYARDASVYVVAAGKANHAGVGSGYGLPTDMANEHMIGIEAESTGLGDWTSAQLAGWPRLNRSLMATYHFPASMIIAHFEWTPRKIDPHGLPGGMAWLRAASAAAPTGDDDMTVHAVEGSTATPTVLTPGVFRTVTMTKAGISIVKGPAGGCRATGFIGLTLDAPAEAPVQVEAYLAKPSPAGWVYAATDGVADFPAGSQHLRYPVMADVPAGFLLRVRAVVAGGSPRTVTQAVYNLDVRS